MSQAEIDKIISKYDKKAQKSSVDVLQTQRKRQSREQHMITFMDNNYTPTKELNDTTKHMMNRKYVGTNEQLLKQLDETEKKYVISQKNYAEVYRKYEKLKQTYDMVENELEKQRKVRLQELIDVQNKLHLLQIDNDKNITKLESKDHTIAILKEKLAQKQEEALIFQQQLELISKKLSETMHLRQKQSLKYAHREISLNSQQANRSLEQMKEKYEKYILSLKSEMDRFNTDLLQKQKEKRKLLQQMQDQSRKHLIEIKQLRQVLFKNEQQYKAWLDEAKKQKLQLIEKYEQEMRDLRKDQFTLKLYKENNAIEQTNKNKASIKQLQSKNLELINQLKAIKSQRESLFLHHQQDQIKLNSLNEELKHLKVQYIHQINENKKILLNLKNEEERYEEMRIKNNRNEIEMEGMKRKCEEILTQNKRLEKQVENLRADMGKELKSLINVKKELSEATDNQMNMNSVLTQTAMKLKAKIQSLEQELQSVTTQLYAERLEKAKIIEQLEQTKVSMKRQYELSLENTKQELEEQIKQNIRGKGSIDMQKQQMYLEMFKLERQYELLKSQIVTADEMLKMGTKMAKYYQRKAK